MHSIVYLHGFNSSAKAQKAAIARDWFATHHPKVDFSVPQLPDNPDSAAESIDAYLDKKRNNGDSLSLIGSSMGGFYANYFAEIYACRAVLINPVVYPHRLLRDYLGEQVNTYTGAKYSLDVSMMDRLQEKIQAELKDNQSRMVLLQTGDETLDYREAQQFYSASQLHVEVGGDHGFQRFGNWLPAIADFFGL